MVEFLNQDSAFRSIITGLVPMAQLRLLLDEPGTAVQDRFAFIGLGGVNPVDVVPNHRIRSSVDQGMPQWPLVFGKIGTRSELELRPESPDSPEIHARQQNILLLRGSLRSRLATRERRS